MRRVLIYDKAHCFFENKSINMVFLSETLNLITVILSEILNLITVFLSETLKLCVLFSKTSYVLFFKTDHFDTSKN